MTAPDLVPRRLTPDMGVFPLALGCWAIGGPTVNAGSPFGWGPIDEDRALEGLRHAVRHGVNFFDTADVFGHGRSERLLGRLLDEVDRESLFVASKAGWMRGSAPHPYAGPRLRHQFEQSIENLGVEYLDVYFLHTLDFGDDDTYLHTVISQMQALREVGYIKAIGMRGPRRPSLPDRQETADVRNSRFAMIFNLLRPDILWTPFNPLFPLPEVNGENLLSFTARHGVALLLTEPLAQGLLTGKYDPDHPPDFGYGDHRKHKRWFSNPGLRIIADGLQPLRERFGANTRDLTRVALRYSLQQADHTAVVVGFSSPEQVQQNLGCIGSPLTDEDMAFVDLIYRRLRANLQANEDHPVEVPV
ncbi:aldo/keto reductase [Streptomyces longwoodensis]|uniref:aldo/keto reductase n=1 Tax=Streptomyces longwoodensis TaxID=68231 RepID=UPI0033AEE6AB